MLSKATSSRKRRVDGILLLDKPAGPSSNQALQHVKRLFCAMKAGHAGTLDPLATGLLPLLFGEATKFASYLSDAHKAYEATILLGVTTSTGDLAGEILERRIVDAAPGVIASVVARFVGAIPQVPPMHSAIKQAGTPLYELARRGQVVSRVARTILIEELSLGRIAGDELDICVRCSKGTYIRVLAEDIGTALGCGATLKRLRRVSVGGFDISRAVSLEALEAADEVDRLRLLLPVDAGLEHLPSLVVSADQAESIFMGRQVPVAPQCASEGITRLYRMETAAFLGLGQVSEGRVQPVRLVNVPEHENVLRRQ